MEIKEKIADLFYILNDIQQFTDDDRIALLADSVQLTIMEMDVLSRDKNRILKAIPTAPFPSMRNDSI